MFQLGDKVDLQTGAILSIEQAKCKNGYCFKKLIER